ncbi:MAG TPA: hypothetical protein VIK80_11550 [Flavihumibacter sp.]|jgi:hypothetical protein
MERVRALIYKLQEQVDQGADASALLVTSQLLQAAIQEQASSSVVRNGNSKVAVVLPTVVPALQKKSAKPDLADIAATSQAVTNKPEVSTVAAKAPAAQVVNGTNKSVPVQETPAQATPAPIPEPEQVQQAAAKTDWLQTLMQEIPTLAHQKEIRELNDVISQQLSGASSLNERLKQQSTEVAEVLTREPVRDLRKAIGVNDRFVFIQELFRGDEVMYERSIKTINSFNILQEAEYWIERELKLKLAWDESRESVRHFCQLVRRRFSSK